MTRPTYRRRLPLLLLAMLAMGTSAAIAEDLSGYTGQQLYRRFCASCHGSSGEGDGPVAPFFKLLPPDLTEIARRSRGVFPEERVRRILDGRENPPPHGAREMPVWGVDFAMSADDPAEGNAVAEATIARLVDYLRTIQKVPRR